MIFKRKIYNELLQWKRTDEGRTAVLIQGARRVGKSTIAEEFATNEYETHILVDFAACSTEIRDLFNDVWKSHATLTLLATQDCPLWLQYD